MFLFIEHGPCAAEYRPTTGRKWARLLPILLLLGWFPVAAQVLGAGSAPLPAAAAEPEYLISPDDVLEVYVLDVPELSRQYKVSATGKVSLPLLSAPLPAAGLTLEQFSELVRTRLQEEGFVSDPRSRPATRLRWRRR